MYEIVKPYKWLPESSMVKHITKISWHISFQVEEVEDAYYTYNWEFQLLFILWEQT